MDKPLVNTDWSKLKIQLVLTSIQKKDTITVTTQSHRD